MLQGFLEGPRLWWAGSGIGCRKSISGPVGGGNEVMRCIGKDIERESECRRVWDTGAAWRVDVVDVDIPKIEVLKVSMDFLIGLRYKLSRLP